MNLCSLRRVIVRASAALLLLTAAAVPAAGQTLQLNESHATTIRGGSYAGTNFSADPLLATRASSDSSYVRRAIVKFDTHNTITQGASIASASLTLTVAGGNSESRTLRVYRISTSYDEPAATWNRRYSATSWSTAGGDLAEQVDTATVTSTAGSRVTFDVTALVRGVVAGQYGSSRYTRIAIVDNGASSQGSYKEYYSDEAGDSSVRPTLTVTLGSSTSTQTSTTTSGTTLKVLMWNTHHGVGTDGRYDINRLASWMARMVPSGVIMLNEVEKYTGWGNEDQPARYRSLLEQQTGRRWYSHWTQEFGNWSSNGKGHLILSTYPIEATGRVEITPSDGLNGAGAAGQATITVNGRTVNFIVTHLDPYSQTMRLTQARDTIRWALNFAENRILGGDMNAWPDQSSIAEYNRTYRDSWAVAESNGTATGVPGITPFGATKKGRIDYIFFSRYASNLVVRSSKVWDTRDANGVMPSDHRPVVTTFEVR
jgi:endonuclease/exonuclease/phosphatase family metal-dependent hydrolase